MGSATIEATRNATQPGNHAMNALTLTTFNGEPRVDSRVIADQLGVEHKSARKLICQYLPDFEKFGVCRFEIAKPPKGSYGGRPEKFALLNEDQSYLLLTYTQNTQQVRELKIRLVRSFGEYRRGVAHPAMNPALPGIPLVLIEGEPRITDMTLADELGLPYPARIRQRIQRNKSRLANLGNVATGRSETEFYLNRQQAVFMCRLIDPKTACDVQVEIASAFDAYLLESKPYLLSEPAP